MVPVWISRRPRDVPTQRQQRTTAEIFQFRRGTYFSQIVELFPVCKVVHNARNRRAIVTGATACRHGTDASSTWFVRATRHKTFLCDRIVRLRVPGVVTLCEELGGGGIRKRSLDTHGRSLLLRHPSPRLRFSLCPAATGVACGHPDRGTG